MVQIVDRTKKESISVKFAEELKNMRYHTNDLCCLIRLFLIYLSYQKVSISR